MPFVLIVGFDQKFCWLLSAKGSLTSQWIVDST